MFFAVLIWLQIAKSLKIVGVYDLPSIRHIKTYLFMKVTTLSFLGMKNKLFCLCSFSPPLVKNRYRCTFFLFRQLIFLWCLCLIHLSRYSPFLWEMSFLPQTLSTLRTRTCRFCWCIRLENFVLTEQSSCIILEEDMSAVPTTYILAEILMSNRHCDLCQDCCLLCTIWTKLK